MSNFKCASAGSVVKIWNSDFREVEELHNLSGGIPSICWSPNNLVLAQLSTTSDRIYLTSFDDEISTKSIGGKEAGERSCVCLDSTSRYVMAGGADGLIHVWDSQSGRLRKTYKALHNNVHTISYNHDDSLVAVGGSADVIIFNAISALPTTLLPPNPSKAATKQLKFSSLKGHLLASVTDEGSTHLWDGSLKRHLYHFPQAHLSPVTALSFSPINHMLMLSAGLDKKIACYDVLSKKMLKCIGAVEPLTCLDIFCDGTTVVAGTSRGKILLFDLRHTASPTKEISAHQSPISSLCLKRKTTRHSHSRKKGSHQPGPSTPPPLTDNINVSDVVSKADNNNSEKNTGDTIFSPCRLEDSCKDSSNISSLQGSLRSASDAAASSFFSPVSLAPTQQKQLQTNESVQFSMNFTTDDLSQLNFTEKLPVDYNGHNDTRPHHNDTQPNHKDAQPHHNDTQAHDSLPHISHTPKLAFSPTHQTASRSSKLHATTCAEHTKTPGGISMEVLRGVVREETEEAMEGLSSCVLNMHSEIIHKFHQLQLEVQALRQETSTMQQHLLHSNNTLSQDNANLRFILEHLT